MAGAPAELRRWLLGEQPPHQRDDSSGGSKRKVHRELGPTLFVALGISQGVLVKGVEERTGDLPDGAHTRDLGRQTELGELPVVRHIRKHVPSVPRASRTPNHVNPAETRA